MRRPFLVAVFATVLLGACSGSVAPCDSGTCEASAPSDANDATLDTSPDGPGDSAADASHALGAPCTEDSQCDSGVCLSVGRCSITCAQRQDCPAGDNWTCSGVPGRGTICDCTMRDTREIGCNRIDDDCDGLTDDHSADCMGLCTDLWINPHNCGGCGVECTNGSVCRNGTCACGGIRPDLCGTQCVNLQTGVNNCGDCTTACPMRANSTPACNSGVCGVTCDLGYGDCNHVASDGCEADVRADPMNCGMCGSVCSFPHAAASCATGTCVMGACEAGYADCNASSLDGCEALVANDVMNCGACNNACSAPNATSACSAGMCSLATCTAGFGNCNASALDGCEIDLRTNPFHCGVCGGTCPSRANATTTCTAGTCGFTCGFGSGDCDANPANGCETSLLADPNHCGACGALCGAAPNQTATCSSGTCQRVCSAGFGDCDGNPANGCEVDLRTSMSNCGACGSVCSRPNATATCSASTCSTVTCNAGFANCDGADFDGCEANLQSDPLHCGSCAGTCPGATVPNTIATCTTATCGFSCAPGFANCDGFLGNGCETDIQTPTNCGACGVACPATQSCLGGLCGCPAGQMPCGTARVCTDTTSDRNNCGACGNVCGAGLECIGAVCSRTSYTGYSISTSTQPFVDACALPGSSFVLAGADDAVFTFTTPFSFVLASYAGTAAWLSSNGAFGGGPASSFLGTACPIGAGSPQPNTVLAFLDDLQARGPICFATSGAAPNRQLVVTWPDMHYCCGDDPSVHLTFSLFLREGSNVIDVVYQQMTGTTDRANGSSAEIGITGGASTTVTQYTCDTASITAPMAIRYTPY